MSLPIQPYCAFGEKFMYYANIKMSVAILQGKIAHAEIKEGGHLQLSTQQCIRLSGASTVEMEGGIWKAHVGTCSVQSFRKVYRC